MSEEETMSRTCTKCGARFLGGRLYWATGKRGDPRDLAGLVCQPYGDASCINPQRDATGGDTWAKRLDFLNAFGSEFDMKRIE